MKIITVDARGRETIVEKLICTNVSKENGYRIVDLLNKNWSGSGTWYACVEDCHGLLKGMEELV